ncbi:uncharacterized protein LOC144775543 isoform X2 [Lissotriton helveticus]
MPILLGHSSKLSSLDLSTDEDRSSDSEQLQGAGQSLSIMLGTENTMKQNKLKVLDIRAQNQIIGQETKDLMELDYRCGGDVKIEVERSTVVSDMVKKPIDDEEPTDNMCKYISSSDSDSGFTWPRERLNCVVHSKDKSWKECCTSPQ